MEIFNNQHKRCHQAWLGDGLDPQNGIRVDCADLEVLDTDFLEALDSFAAEIL